MGESRESSPPSSPGLAGQAVRLWQIAKLLAVVSVLFQFGRHLQYIPSAERVAGAGGLVGQEVEERDVPDCAEEVARQLYGYVKSSPWSMEADSKLAALADSHGCEAGKPMLDAIYRRGLQLMNDELALPTEEAEVRAGLCNAAATLFELSAGGDPNRLRAAAEAALVAADITARRGVLIGRGQAAAQRAADLFGMALDRIPEPDSQMAALIRAKRAETRRAHGLAASPADQSRPR